MKQETKDFLISLVANEIIESIKAEEDFDYIEQLHDAQGELMAESIDDDCEGCPHDAEYCCDSHKEYKCGSHKKEKDYETLKFDFFQSDWESIMKILYYGITSLPEGNIRDNLQKVKDNLQHHINIKIENGEWK